MTLGLTNSTDNGGLNSYNNGHIVPVSEAYGQSTSPSSGGSNAINGHIGITLDSSKSGMIISKDITKYLNFFIN